MEKMFRVSLKPGHLTGTYHRGGIEFTSRTVTTTVADVVILTEAQVTEAIRADPWLLVEELLEENR